MAASFCARGRITPCMSIANRETRRASPGIARSTSISLERSVATSRFLHPERRLPRVNTDRSAYPLRRPAGGTACAMAPEVALEARNGWSRHGLVGLLPEAGLEPAL